MGDRSDPKNVKTPRKIKVWRILAGPKLGTQKSSKAFPCSAALVSFCTGAFPCSVALVFQFLMLQMGAWSNMASVRASETL